MAKAETKSNSLKIDTKEIIKLVSDIARNSYGVIEIASKDEVSLFSKIANIAKKGKKEEGIFLLKRADNTFTISIYLILSQEVKITEVLRGIQESVQYALNKKYPHMCKEVNVYANELR